MSSRSEPKTESPRKPGIPDPRLAAIAERLMAAQDAAARLDPITRNEPSFDVGEAYEVLGLIEQRRRAAGWQPVGRKIGFTNRTLWPRYGVFQPMGARVWSRTVQYAANGVATQPLAGFVQPRIEPEVVFKLRAPI